MSPGKFITAPGDEGSAQRWDTEFMHVTKEELIRGLNVALCTLPESL